MTNGSLSSHKASITMDGHWRPEAYASLPCTVNYTLIGEFNNFAPDINVALKAMTLQNYTSARESNPSPKLYSTLSEWYSQLDGQLQNDVRELYKHDFFMFDYDSTLPGEA